MNTDAKTMLALAALTYRGFGKHSEAAIEAALRPWLSKLDEEGLGKWELVWGPVTFRARTSLFDDAMMYVAQQQDRLTPEPHYVIAIRGTNPISVFDWIFGDFWVSLQVDWSNPGDPAAKLSASTALGLVIVKHLAAEVPPSRGNKLDAVGNALSSAFEHLADALPELEPAQFLQKSSAFSEAALMARIRTLMQFTGERTRLGPLGSLFARFVGSIQPLQDRIHKEVFDNLVHEIEATADKGHKLVEFLKSVKPNSTVSVTGHSKGGALSLATALWLAEEWAPHHPAQIEAFTFAGPTPGNGAFKKRYDATLAARTHRIVNPRDVVPHAFAAQQLRGMSEFYRALGPALDFVANSVERLGYEHVGGDVVEIEPKKGDRGLFEEIIHQHLDAYLTAAGFGGSSWNTRSIFLDE